MNAVIVRRIPVVLLISGLLLALAGPLRADSELERFLDGLRQRRLFQLAENYCRNRLADEQLPEVERANLTMELIRTYASHAVNSAPDQRPAFWKQAHDTADEFATRQRANPRLVLVQAQDALTFLAEGELLRQEFEAGDRPEALRQAALVQIRNAANRLEQLDEQLTKDIPLRRRGTVDNGLLSAEELASLQNNLRFQLARAYRNRALCHDPDTADRVDALTRAMEKHDELLRQLSPDDPLRWQVRIDNITCRRLLGDLENALRLLTALQAEQLPPDVQLAGRAESVRLELASGRPEVALRILGQGRKAAGRISAELDFAHIEAYDAMARAAKDDAEAAKWQKNAADMARIVEETHGPYWGRRANLLLVHSAAAGGAKDMDVLVRVADNAYLQGQFDEAVQTYDSAAQMAAGAGRADAAFSLAYKAGLVEHQRQHHAEAARRLRELSLKMKSHSDAPAAHLLAAWNVAQLAGSEPAELSRYVELLEEQAATWPEHATADTARMWLGRIREQQQSWREAIDIYLDVSPTSDQFAGAVHAAARCAEQYLAAQQDSGSAVEEQASLLAQRFEDLVFDAQRQPPAQWSVVARDAALTAARIRLQYTASGHATAAALLQAALDGSPAAPAEWQTTARALLVVALAGQIGRRAEAGQIVAKLADGDPAELLEMLGGLATIGRTAPAPVQVEVAALQLQATDLLWQKREQLAPDDQINVQRLRAEALALTGKRAEAQEAFERLATQHPRNGVVQEAYALFLSAGTDRQSQQQALDRWRIVAGGSRPQSERWFRAKYQVALAQFQLGDKESAARLLKYLQETPPGWRDSALRGDFEQLLKRCER